ncbi:MAG TPA: hypothetical protein VKT81_06150 [Bryobacteraceae bacterium]|nr:hypothetical protein [Bryobacteraceae bacterium]
MLLRVESIMLPVMAVALALAAQTNQVSDSREIHLCATTHCWGKRIKQHGFGLIQFCRPFGTDFHRAAGFEGDIHDSITFSSKGETSQLIIFTANATWGPVQTKPAWFGSPEAPEGTVHGWHCSQEKGRDFRLTKNGRSWRLLTFITGYAEYKDVPQKAAMKFDRILDSLCYQPWPPSERTTAEER